MKYRTLNRNESDTLMKEWIRSQSLPVITSEEQRFRDYLVKEYRRIKEETKDYYQIDLRFGIAIYKYLEQLGDFTMRIASDDGYWRFVSLMIIPDIVGDRWGNENDSHFWSRTTRIWVRQIWWYIYLAWQGDKDLNHTRKVLSQPGFSTDEIMNLVERCGRKGSYIDVYRRIVYMYSQVSDEERRRLQDGRKTLFRRIMILNTARSVVVDPYLRGVNEYVDDIFKELKVRL